MVGVNYPEKGSWVSQVIVTLLKQGKFFSTDQNKCSKPDSKHEARTLALYLKHCLQAVSSVQKSNNNVDCKTTE